MNYWTERQKQLYTAMEKDEAELKSKLSSFYNSEYAKLDKEIAAYYQKYGENNVIAYRRLMETLPAEDVKLLIEQMDKFAVKYPQYANLIPVRTSIYKLNRLEGLQYSIRMQQLNIGAVNIEKVTEHLNKQATRGLNASAEVMGFGKNFYSENAEIIKQFVNVPWSSGKNFSQRIWQNTDKLSDYLNTDIAQGFARGESYERLTQQLRSRFSSVTRNDAYRLIYTEGTYVMAESSMQPFTEDFEKYRVSTAADGKVCSICRDIARNEYYIKDRKPGINFPPFHAWCRCTFEIVVDDWNKWLDDYVKRHSTNKPNAEKVLNNFSGNDKITAGKSSSYYDLLKYNSNASFKVFLNNYSKKTNDCLSKACYDVAKQGGIDGKEHLSLVDLIKGEIVYTETGIDNAVGGWEFWEFITKNSNGSYAFVHNHNTASEFSETDLKTLLGQNSVCVFINSRIDGKIYVIEKASTPETLNFDRLFSDALIEINQKSRNGEITPGERTRLREEAIVDNAIKKYTKGLKIFG